MGTVRTGRLISAAFDGLLVPAGFQAGQYGEGDEDVDGDTQVIYCASRDEFSVRCPDLSQAIQQEADGGCIDLVIEVRADGVLALLDLEGTSIARALHHVGLATVGEDVAGVVGGSFDQSIPVVAAALSRLFNAEL